MYNIQTLNKISAAGLSKLGDNYAVADDCAAPDAILVRSAAMHDMELPESLLAHRLGQEVLHHLFRDGIIADNALTKRTHCYNITGRTSDHQTRVLTDGFDIIGIAVKRWPRRTAAPSM